MAKTISNSIADQAIEDGVKLGNTTAGRDTKWSWWEVYFHDGKIIAAVFSKDWMEFAQEIEESELKGYVEDFEAAQVNFAKAKQPVVLGG